MPHSKARVWVKSLRSGYISRVNSMGMESRGESLALELNVWGSRLRSPTHSLGDLGQSLIL